MKFRITVEMTCEYEPRIEDYPPGTPEDMLRVDVDGYADDPALLFLDKNTTIKVSGEVFLS